MKSNHPFLGLGIVLFSAVGFLYVHSLNLRSEVGLSPGIFPQFIFVLMAICGCVIFFEATQESTGTLLALNWKKFLPLAVILALYSYALEYLGFLISTVVFLALALYLFEEKRLKVLLMVPILASFLIYFMFTEFFLIPLP